ncbi:BTB domain-containing protein [Aphelenchoides besseyi]|nr:BTB domain-containing protein [Aphelenchoides besseyi]
MLQVLGDAPSKFVSVHVTTRVYDASPSIAICLLTGREMVEIFIYFGSNELTNDTSERSESHFCKRRRCRMYGRELVINRFQRVEQRWCYTGSFDRIKCAVDVPIFITALSLYESLTANAMYNVVITITDCSITKSIARTELKFESNGTGEPFRIPFAEPGPDSFYGSTVYDERYAKASNAVTFLLTFAAGTNNGTFGGR